MTTSSRVQTTFKGIIGYSNDRPARAPIVLNDPFCTVAVPPLDHFNRLIIIVSLAVFVAAASFSVAIATMIGLAATAATGLVAILLLAAVLISLTSRRR